MLPAHINNDRELMLADFAFEFIEVEVQSSSNDFFLDFEVYPLA